MKRTTLLVIALFICLAMGAAAGPGKKATGQLKVAKADKETVLTMAAAAIKKYEPRLKDENKENSG